MTDREEIIQNYIDGYNQFDVDRMVRDFDHDIVFENIQSGEVTMSLSGLPSLRAQAEQAKAYFSTRRQTIRSFKHFNDHTEIEIEYHAILAMDFPNGLKKGQPLDLVGESIFHFSGGKIIKLTDIS